MVARLSALYRSTTPVTPFVPPWRPPVEVSTVTTPPEMEPSAWQTTQSASVMLAQALLVWWEFLANSLWTSLVAPVPWQPLQESVTSTVLLICFDLSMKVLLSAELMFKWQPLHVVLVVWPLAVGHTTALGADRG